MVTFSDPARVKSLSVLAVMVPLKMAEPVTVKPLLTVVVPVPAPILKVVAAPAKLTVVAVALTREKVVEGVVIEVVMSGEVILGVLLKTTRPEDEPVSSDRAVAKAEEARAETDRLPEPSVVTNLEAVKLVVMVAEPRLTLPDPT